jgi:hypothetical protein
MADPFNGQRADLTDLDPGFFREASRAQFERERKFRSLRLARERYGDYGSGTLIEDVMA